MSSEQGRDPPQEEPTEPRGQRLRRFWEGLALALAILVAVVALLFLIFDSERG
jgi:hypothetical protein